MRRTSIGETLERPRLIIWIAASVLVRCHNRAELQARVSSIQSAANLET